MHAALAAEVAFMVLLVMLLPTLCCGQCLDGWKFPSR